MLFKYLIELKKSLPRRDFLKFMKDIEKDIKVNRIAFNKTTSQKEFIEICEGLKMVLRRCEGGQVITN